MFPYAQTHFSVSGKKKRKRVVSLRKEGRGRQGILLKMINEKHAIRLKKLTPTAYATQRTGEKITRVFPTRLPLCGLNH